MASLGACWPKPASSVIAAGRCCGVDTLMAERSASSFGGICSGRSCPEGSCWRSSRTRCAYCSSITCMRLSSSRRPSSSVIGALESTSAIAMSARVVFWRRSGHQAEHPTGARSGPRCLTPTYRVLCAGCMHVGWDGGCAWMGLLVKDCLPSHTGASLRGQLNSCGRCAPVRAAHGSRLRWRKR